MLLHSGDPETGGIAYNKGPHGGRTRVGLYQEAERGKWAKNLCWDSGRKEWVKQYKQLSKFKNDYFK